MVLAEIIVMVVVGDKTDITLYLLKLNHPVLGDPRKMESEFSSRYHIEVGILYSQVITYCIILYVLYTVNKCWQSDKKGQL